MRLNILNVLREEKFDSGCPMLTAGWFIALIETLYVLTNQRVAPLGVAEIKYYAITTRAAHIPRRLT
jgi:hypothetical protein